MNYSSQTIFAINLCSPFPGRTLLVFVLIPGDSLLLSKGSQFRGYEVHLWILYPKSFVWPQRWWEMLFPQGQHWGVAPRYLPGNCWSKGEVSGGVTFLWREISYLRVAPDKLICHSYTFVVHWCCFVLGQSSLINIIHCGLSTSSWGQPSFFWLWLAECV